MVAGAITGNISSEAIKPFVNIFADALRGTRCRRTQALPANRPREHTRYHIPAGALPARDEFGLQDKN